MQRTRMHVRAAVATLLLAAGALGSGVASGAEPAWIGGQITLNLRSGPGAEYRILATLHTGDRVQVLGRDDGWTRVSDPEGRKGWLPGGFLEDRPPAAVRVAGLESETEELRSRLERTDAEAKSLRAYREEHEHTTTELKAEIERLTAENRELAAGSRWVTLVAGASILGAGMLLGSMLRGGARRTSSRLRL